MREDLDKVAPDHPVILRCGVRAFINSRGLQEAEKAFPGYTEFIDKSSGRKNAAEWGWIIVPEISVFQWELWMHDVPLETIAEIFRRNMAKFPSLGITTIGTRIPHPTIVSGYSNLHRSGKMPIRFAIWLETQRSPTHPEAAATLYKRTGSFWPMGDDTFWVMGMASEYWDSNYPEQCLGADLEAPKAVKDREVCPAPGQVYWDVYQNAIEAGWRPGGVHGVGSDGVRRYIQMIEMAMKNKGLTVDYIRTLRPTVEHCDVIGTKPDVVAKLKEYNFIISCGPDYIRDTPLHIADYGPKIEPFILPLKSLIQQGVKVVGQHTASFANGAFNMIGMAVTRNMGGTVYQPDERVDRFTALKMWTRWAAEFVYKEKDIGSLEVGKLADFTVLDRDYFTIPENDIRNIRPLMTAIGCELRYVDGKVASEFGVQPAGVQMPPEFPYIREGGFVGG